MSRNVMLMSMQVPPLFQEAIGVNGYSYVYAGGLPVEQIAPDGTILYYIENRQGSTVALTDSTGKVVARYAYSAYGSLICGPFTHPNTPPNSPPCHPSPPTPPAACPPAATKSPVGPPPCIARAIAANHFLYDGQYLDNISGLYYLRARWYDPATGQFTSVDALVTLTGQPYSYAGGDPVNGSDPNGLVVTGVPLDYIHFTINEAELEAKLKIIEFSNPITFTGVITIATADIYSFGEAAATAYIGPQTTFMLAQILIALLVDGFSLQSAVGNMVKNLLSYLKKYKITLPSIATNALTACEASSSCAMSIFVNTLQAATTGGCLALTMKESWWDYIFGGTPTMTVSSVGLGFGWYSSCNRSSIWQFACTFG